MRTEFLAENSVQVLGVKRTDSVVAKSDPI